MKKIVSVGILLLYFLQVECRRGRKYDAEESCTRELHLRRGRMKQIINEVNTSEDNITYGQFLYCVFQRRDVMNDNGTISGNGLQNFLDAIFFDRSSAKTDSENASIRRVFDACLNTQKTTKYKTAISLKNCIARYILENEPHY